MKIRDKNFKHNEKDFPLNKNKTKSKIDIKRINSSFEGMNFNCVSRVEEEV